MFVLMVLFSGWSRLCLVKLFSIELCMMVMVGRLLLMMWVLSWG